MNTATAGNGPRDAREVSSAFIATFVAQRRMKVLTFAGYSGALYEDPSSMLAQAEKILAANNPAEVLVNIGATAEGIGQVYELAKRLGFTTMGIVSTLARDEKVPLSPCVDHVFFIADDTWGGIVASQGELSPTSAAIVAITSSFVAIGGGDVARDEMLAVRRAGKPVQSFPADLNHALATEKAAKRGQPEPTDFRGSAHDAFANGS